jgi:RecA-family ATPase
MPALQAAIHKAGGASLMIVDPIVSAVAGDGHKSGDVRRGLQPVVDLAMQERCALFGITHLSKGTSGRDPLERIMGSLSFWRARARRVRRGKGAAKGRRGFGHSAPPLVPALQVEHRR